MIHRGLLYEFVDNPRKVRVRNLARDMEEVATFDIDGLALHIVDNHLFVFTDTNLFVIDIDTRNIVLQTLYVDRPDAPVLGAPYFPRPLADSDSFYCRNLSSDEENFLRIQKSNYAVSWIQVDHVESDEYGQFFELNGDLAIHGPLAFVSLWLGDSDERIGIIDLARGEMVRTVFSQGKWTVDSA